MILAKDRELVVDVLVGNEEARAVFDGEALTEALTAWLDEVGDGMAEGADEQVLVRHLKVHLGRRALGRTAA